VLALVVAGFAFAAWPAARDVLAGVSLKAGRVCHEGDHVRFGDLEGRVVSMGYRVLTMETTNGDQAIVPYSRIAREALVRTRSLGGVSAHRFELDVATPGAFSELRSRIAEAALLSHWCAFTREPEVRPLGEGGVEVTVFSLDAHHGPDIEAAVRASLAPADA
jgi:small-conductance mechanosensitive channel